MIDSQLATRLARLGSGCEPAPTRVALADTDAGRLPGTVRHLHLAGFDAALLLAAKEHHEAILGQDAELDAIEQRVRADGSLRVLAGGVPDLFNASKTRQRHICVVDQRAGSSCTSST